MTPIGQHITISKPEPLNNYEFIVEKESVSKAVVIEVSKDLKVPFRSGDTVMIYTGKHITVRENEFTVSNEMVIAWE